jgi:hypothetical protein
MALHGMARAPRALIDTGAQTVDGDLKDRASLDAACASHLSLSVGGVFGRRKLHAFVSQGLQVDLL